MAYGAEAVTGRTLRPGKKLEGWVRDAGFANVHVVKNVLPIGAWPKDPKLASVLPVPDTLSSLKNCRKNLENITGFSSTRGCRP